MEAVQVSHRFNSVLTLSTWISTRCHRLRAQSHKKALISDASHKAKLPPVLLTDCCRSEVFMTPSLASITLQERLTERSKLQFTYLIIGVLQRIGKDTNQQPDEEIQRARPEQRSLCPHGVRGSARWHVDVFWFPSLEALRILTFGFLWRLHYIGMTD